MPSTPERVSSENLDRIRRIWELESRERELRAQLEEARIELAEASRSFDAVRAALRKAELHRYKLEGWSELEPLLRAGGVDYRKRWTLARAGVLNIAVLCSLSRTDLLEMKGMGPVSVDRIEEVLATRGIALAATSRRSIA